MNQTHIIVIILVIIVVILISTRSEGFNPIVRAEEIAKNSTPTFRLVPNEIAKNSTRTIRLDPNEFAKNSTHVGDMILKINGDYFRKNKEIFKEMRPIGIANDGDVIKFQKFLGDYNRPVALLYGTDNSPEYVLREMRAPYEDVLPVTCLPETFGGIDPAPNVKKTCYFVSPNFK